MSVDFSLFRLRFSFQAEERVHFAPMAANTLRGAFGYALRETHGEEFEAIFAPSATAGHPSGLADSPRPFVFRCAHLDGAILGPGAPFSVDVHLFETRRPLAGVFADAFRAMGQWGIGKGSGRATLSAVDEIALNLPLVAVAAPVHAASIDFLTPTELKFAAQAAPEPLFPALFARVRDRISTLRALYGAGPLAVDFRGLGERAREVRMISSRIRFVEVTRRSSRTGQVHPIGGFVGSAAYEGPLAEFLPWLQAASFTGVGRQTTWGKGEIRVKAQ